MSSDLESNKKVVRAHFEALATGDYEVLDRLHDPSGRNHAPAPFDLSEWPPGGKQFGPSDARATFEWLRGGTPDLAVEIEELIAEGDQVDAWVRMTGTPAGPTGPVRATGRATDVRHVHRFRIREGRIVEHWAVRDDLRLMLQAGVLQPPSRPPT